MQYWIWIWNNVKTIIPQHKKHLKSRQINKQPFQSYMNEWMNEWCIYIALYCVLPYTQSALQSYGASLLNHHQCAASTWMMRRQPQDNGASALTTHKLQVERRESHRANQVDKDYLEAMIDKGQWREFGQDTGVTPLLFTRSAMGFLVTTESQDLGLTSHPKDGAFYSIVSPSLYWGIRTHTDHRVSTPCWPH